MRNTGLEEAQAGIKIAGRNINNLRYADDTTLMAGNEELKSILMKVRQENEKVGLKLNIQKLKIMVSGPITLWQIDGTRCHDLRFLSVEFKAGFFTLLFHFSKEPLYVPLRLSLAGPSTDFSLGVLIEKKAAHYLFLFLFSVHMNL